MVEHFFIKGIKVSACNIESSTNAILHLARNKTNSFICVTDSGNIVTAVRKNQSLKNAINNSLLSLPDGRPLSILGKIKGYTKIGRVAGPDIMMSVITATQNSNCSHYFFGDTVEVLERLYKKLNLEYPGLKIAGIQSPSFEEWDQKTQSEIIAQINSNNPNILWVGLGGGKQEIWMHTNYEKMSGCVMVGVGAAFRFYLGDIKRAPFILQYLSLEWLFRLIQQPGKMFLRYFMTLPIFVLYFIKELILSPKMKKK